MPHVKNQRTRKQDKRVVKKAALALWITKLHQSADKACTAVGGYETSGEANASYWTVITKIKDLATELDDAAKKKKLPQTAAALRAPARATSSAYGSCDDDNECPDDYICLNHVCQTPFPQG
jgi:hypothetical protein